MTPAIEARGVTVRFGKVTAVERASLSVAPGEVFGLLGPNGSGKTTLIRAFCGLVPAAEGAATVLGEDSSLHPERVRQSIGYMSQKFSLYQDLTVRENMEFYAGIYGMGAAETRARRGELESMAGLGPYVDRRAGRLSGGWKQRLALACALLHRPRLVFLDEPTAGIDPVARRDVWNLLFRLSAEGITLFVTTHYMDEAERCSRVGYIQDSRMLAVGTPAELKALPVVTPPGTRRVKIRAEDPSAALERLRSHPGVREATIFGQSIRALVDEGADLGLDPDAVRPAHAGLEDVFIALSRDRGLVTAGRVLAVARKEVIHILRDPTTLFFAFLIPIIELILLGFAIDTNVRHVRTALLDEAKTQESRALVRAFETTDDFDVTEIVSSEADLTRLLVSGRCRVGLRIPEDFSRRILAGGTGQFLVLVDGSESSVAAEGLNVANAVALRESLRRALGDRPLPVEARPRILFNPDTRSPNFFIPGLMVVLVQMMSVMLTASAVVREKENGTLEQLYMTPVRSSEIVLGKVIPYSCMAIGELCGIALLMRFLFHVPIHGSFGTLLLMVLPFVLSMQGLGLLISARAATRDAAMQMAMGTVIPSIFLSGYVFPLDSMPVPFQWIGRALPTTWLIDASRGVILRGAGWAELWPNAAVLGGMAIVVLGVTALRFPRRVG